MALADLDLRALRVPTILQEDVSGILALTDGFCIEHLDEEYAELSRRLVAKLARKRSSPLARGDLRTWAAAAIYTVGSVNFLFDPAEQPHLRADDLARLTGVAKSTMANKARAIRQALGTGQLDPEFCRRELLERHPFAWLVEMNGFVVDVRSLPEPFQDEARRRGLVPDLR